MKNQGHSLVFGPVLGSLASLCLLIVVQNALANPIGGSVASGKASIVSQGPTTTITQTTQTAIINWQDFSINAGQTTQFKQPSSSSITLNRVTGGNVSQIMGNLTANGNIYLLNPNGVLFGKGANVNVGGLLVSTSKITDQSFLSGNNMQFTSGGNPKASIINNGLITIKNAGYAVLVAPNVVNNGVITANMGRVEIGSADHFVLDLYGDNLINYDAGTINSNAQLINAGTITANGGEIRLTAQAAGQAVKNVVNMSGILQARSAGKVNGKIQLIGGANSIANISGYIDASGSFMGQVGGLIQISATYVNLLSGSKINASGYAGGGTVHIGSDVFHLPGNNLKINSLGLPSTMPTAQYVNAAPDSNIDANSLSSGDGGTVVVWADTANYFSGIINANRGKVETSGGYLDVTGAKIKAGTWLLDPTDLNITDTSPTTGTFSGSNPSNYVPDGVADPSNIYGVDLQTELAGGTSVILDTSTVNTGADVGNVTFSNITPIAWNGTASLTVYANQNIAFTSAGALNNTGTGSITLRADSQGTGTGTVSFGGNTINSTGAVNIYYNPSAYTSPTNYSGNITGGGTLTAYMLVNTAADLNTIAATSSVWNQDFALGKNIDMSATANFAMIGTSATAFTGIFNGNNDTISNLTISHAVTDVGFFGNVSGATISNITLITPNVTGTTNVGAIIGNASGSTLNGTFNVTEAGASTSTIAGTTTVGGIFGLITGASTIGSTATLTTPSGLTVTGSSNVGGLIGSLAASTLYNSTQTFINNAYVTSTAIITSIGGIFGAAGSGLTITNALTNNGDILDSTFTISNNEAIGGIMGNASGLTFNSTLTNTGNITGVRYVGGLFGEIASSTFKGALVSTNGNVTADLQSGSIGFFRVGGLIGQSGVNMTYTNTSSLSLTQNTSSAVTAISSLNTASTTFSSTEISGVIGYLMPNNLDFEPTSVSATTANGGQINIVETGSYPADATGGLIGDIPDTNVAMTRFAPGAMTSDVNISVFATNEPTHYSADSVGGIIGESFYGTTTAGSLTFSSTLTNAGLISTPHEFVGGIFGYMAAATFNGSLINTGVITAENTAANNAQQVGGIGGYVNNSNFNGSISNTSPINGNYQIGGDFGQVQNSIFNVSLSSGVTVTATGPSASASIIGGLIGEADNTTFNNDLTFTGTVNGADQTGGVIGYASNCTFIGNISTNGGSVSGTTQVGGAIGAVDNSTLDGSITNTGTSVTGTGSDLGGLIGLMTNGNFNSNTAVFTNSAEVIDVGSNTNVGGVMGSWTTGATSGNPATFINNGLVDAPNSTNVGGIVGSVVATSGGVLHLFNSVWTENGDITAAQSATLPAVITGLANVGGIVGLLGGDAGNITEGTTVNVNFVNPVSGTDAIIGFGDNVGGVVGLMGGGTGATSMPAYNLNLTCTSSGASCGISGFNNVSGMIGKMDNGAVFNDNLNQSSYFDVIGSASGIGNNIGGLVGSMTGSAQFLHAVYNNANVDDLASGGTGVGGVFGSITTNTTYTTGAWLLDYTGTINAPNATDVGGVIGNLAPIAGTVTFTGYYFSDSGNTVTGLTNVGGTIGSINPSVGAVVDITSGGLDANSIVNGTTNVGGIIGYINGNGASDSVLIPAGITAKTSTNGVTNVGGLIGEASGFTFSGDYNHYAHAVTGSTNVGGIVGLVTGGSTLAEGLTIESGLSGSLVTGSANVGGIIGNLDASTIYSDTTGAFTANSSNIVSTSADIKTIGGIFGSIGSGLTITNALTNQGHVISTFSGTPVSSAIGGITGDVNNVTFTNTLTNSGLITGLTNAGGLFGMFESGSVSGSLINSGDVSGTQYIGGLVGEFDGGTLTGALTENSGSLSATTSDMGGIIGHMTGNTSLNLSNVTIGAGVNFNVGTSSDVGGVIGLLEDGGGFTPSLTGTFNTNTINASPYNSLFIGYNFGAIIGLINNASNFNSSFTNDTSFDTSYNTLINVGGIAGAVTGTTNVSGFLTNNGSILHYGYNVGGIFGDFQSTLTGDLLTSNGDIQGARYAAGLIGVVEGPAVINAHSMNVTNAVGQVTIEAEDPAGLIGEVAIDGVSTFAVTTTMTSDATVTNQSPDFGFAGGIIARVEPGTSITLNADMTNTGAVESAAGGGVIGLVVFASVTGHLTDLGSVTINGSGNGGGGIFGEVYGSTVSGQLTVGDGTTPVQIIANNGNFPSLSYVIGNMISSDLASTQVTVNSNVSFVGVNGGITQIGGIAGSATSSTFSGFNAPGYVINSPIDLSGTDASEVGSVVGYLNSSTLTGSFNSLTDVTAATDVGGVFGLVENSTIQATVKNTHTVKGTNSVGGIIGAFGSGTISGSLTETGSATHPLTATTSDLGGVIGVMTGGSLDLANVSVASATVFSSPLDIGGAIGLFEGGTLTNSFNTNNLTITGGTNVGALIGQINGLSNYADSFTNATNLTASTSDAVGGVAGFIQNSSFTSAAVLTNEGSVTGASMVGGVAGEVDPTDLNGGFVSGPNTGTLSVTGTSNVGGVFGYITGGSTIDTSATISTLTGLTVTGTSNVGGLIGYLDASTNYNVTANTFTNNANVTSTAAINSIGGIFGFVGSGLTIGNPLTNNGQVSDTNALAIGGIMGASSGVSFTNTLTNAGEIDGENNAGGLFGKISGGTLGISTAANSFSNSGGVNTTNASANANVGGIIGYFTGGSIIYGSLSDSGVVGNATTPSSTNVGGLIGLIDSGAIYDPTNIGVNFQTTAGAAVYGVSNVGGLFGQMAGGNFRTFSIGTAITNIANVTATGSNVGGIVGWNSAGYYQVSINYDATINYGTVIDTGTNSHVGGGIGYVTSTYGFACNFTNYGIIYAPNSNSVGGIFGAVTAVNSGDTLSTGYSAYNEVGDMTAAQTAGYSAVITGANYVGGLIGTLGGGAGTIYASGFYSTVTFNNPVTGVNAITASGNYVGGGIGFMGSAAGSSKSTTLWGPGGIGVNSSSAGGVYTTISGASDVGGVIGEFGLNSGLQLGGGISNDSNLVVIGSGSNVGGLVGEINSPLTTFNGDNPFTNSFGNNATVQVSGSGTGIGGVVGTVDGTGSFTYSANMGNIGTVTGNSASAVGGVFGKVSDPNFTFSGSDGNTGNVSGTQYIGGLVGEFDGGTLTGALAENNGSLSATTSDLGGIIGVMTGGSVNLANLSVDSATVFSSPLDIGGAIGLFEGGTLSNSFSTNDLTITGGTNVGALIGKINGLSNYAGSITNGTNLTASNSNAVGGVAGLIQNSSFTSAAALTNNGSVTGASMVGGLAGELNGGTLTGALTENSGSLSATTSDLGGIIGHMIGNAHLNLNNITLDSSVFSSVSGISDLGGVVGLLESSGGNTPTITGILPTSALTFTGTNTNVGVLIGKMNNVTNFTSALTNNTKLTALDSSVVGGLVGLVDNSTIGVSGTNTATIRAKNTVGGLFGSLLNSTVGSTLASVSEIDTGAVTGTFEVGGVAGSMQGNSSLSQAGLPDSSTSTVTGVTDVGGVVGDLISGTINSSFNNSNHTVIGITNVGGIVGLAAAGTFLNDVWFGGTINSPGATDVGGLVGLNLGTITDGLGIGTITGGTNVGDLVGDNTAGVLLNTFWDTLLPGVPVGIGSSAGTIAGQGNILSLGLLSTYVNQSWSPTIWQVVYGNYASMIWCGGLCQKALVVTPPPVPVNPTVVLSTLMIIQAQITNAENGLAPSSSNQMNDVLWDASTGIKITPANSIIGLMNLPGTNQTNASDQGSSSSSQNVAVNGDLINQVNWFMDNTYVLQWLDYSSLSNEDPVTYTIDAVSDAVSAQASSMSCPVASSGGGGSGASTPTQNTPNPSPSAGTSSSSSSSSGSGGGSGQGQNLCNPHNNPNGSDINCSYTNKDTGLQKDESK